MSISIFINVLKWALARGIKVEASISQLFKETHIRVPEIRPSTIPFSNTLCPVASRNSQKTF
jgi:hypothetical protein